MSELFFFILGVGVGAVGMFALIWWFIERMEEDI